MSILVKTKPVPSVLKVIRKHKNDYSWWSVRTNNDLYYSSIINEKHCIYSFLDETASKNCLSFLQKYHKINNKYPDLYNNDLKNLIDRDTIYISSESTVSMKRRCLVNNIGLIGITSFEYTFYEKDPYKKNIFDLSISSIDLLYEEKEEFYEVIENLNELLEF
jgi:hypothetical protein